MCWGSSHDHTGSAEQVLISSLTGATDILGKFNKRVFYFASQILNQKGPRNTNFGPNITNFGPRCLKL